MADKNFISILGAIPYWPDELIPLDAIFKQLMALLQIDTSGYDPLEVLGGAMGVRSLKMRQYDGITTVTGDLVVAKELTFSPFGNYVGLTLGSPDGDPPLDVTTFPFELTVCDNEPLRNSDTVIEQEPDPNDPQSSAFSFAKRPDDLSSILPWSWELRLPRLEARIRILNGVSRVEPLNPQNPGKGFRYLPDQSVEASITCALELKNDGQIRFYSPQAAPGIIAPMDDAPIQANFGLFAIDGCGLVIAADGLTYRQTGRQFPPGLTVPDGIGDDWEGFAAARIGAYWMAEVPSSMAPEVNVHGGEVTGLLINGNTFSATFAYVHGGGTDDPFESPTPVSKEVVDSLSSQFSIRRMDLSITGGPFDVFQISGSATAAVIIDFFKYQPIKFELSIGHVVKAIPGSKPEEHGVFLSLQGGIAPVQNFYRPDPAGWLVIPIFDIFLLEITGARFEFSIPAANLGGATLYPIIEVTFDVGLKWGWAGAPSETPTGGLERDIKFGINASSLGFRYADGKWKFLLGGVWIEVAETLPFDLDGFDVALSRISLGIESGPSNRYWIGFDAFLTLTLLEVLGKAEIYGLKIGWDDSGLYSDIEGIGLGVKTDNFQIAGRVQFLSGSPPFSPSGSANQIVLKDGSLSGSLDISFSVLESKLRVSAGFIYGRYALKAQPQNEEAFWMFAGEFVFPKAIPMFSSDLGLWGLALMFGDNIAPLKSSSQSWYGWYAQQPPAFEVASPQKWTASAGGWAFGLGMLFGSQLHGGYPYNGRMMAILSGNAQESTTDFMMEAKLRILKEITAPGDPIATLLIVNEPSQLLMRADFDVDFPTAPEPIKGFIFSARGLAEILVDKSGANASHLYIGHYQPLSERITSEVFGGIFTARSFFAIDGRDFPLSAATLPRIAFAFGFLQEWGFDKKWGPLRIYAEAGIEVEAGFSTLPALYVYARLYGRAGLSLWGFGFGIGIDAALIIFVSGDEWSVDGKLTFRLNLPWPIPDFKVSVPLHWGSDPSAPVPHLSPVRQLALTAACIDGGIPVADWSEDNELSLHAENAQVKLPVDGSLLLSLRKPCSSNCSWLAGVDVQPVDGSGDWVFRYTLEDIRITRRLPGQPEELLPDDYKVACWELENVAAASSGRTGGESQQTANIRIWGDGPGGFLKNLGSLERSGAVTWLDAFLNTNTTWPCGPNADLSSRVLHFDLESYRLPDEFQTRITVLPDGLPIRSLFPFDFSRMPPSSKFLVLLDEVIENPHPELVAARSHVLTLPYLCIHPSIFDPQGNYDLQMDPIPFIGLLEVRLPPSRVIRVETLSEFAAETTLVVGCHGDQRIIVSHPETGFGRHVFVLDPPNQRMDRILIYAFHHPIMDPVTPPVLSSLVSVSFSEAGQMDVDNHIRETRERLDSLFKFYEPPPVDLPGQNAEHFLLHVPGTEYRITPIVSVERRGPESDWETVYRQQELETAQVIVGRPPDDLTAYIDWTIPGYGADPVYLDDDVRIRFKRAYGPELFTMGGYRLSVDILDLEGRAIGTDACYAFSSESALTPEQQMILDELNEAPCVSNKIESTACKLDCILRPDLKPRSKYQLVLTSDAHPGKTLYKSPFITSAYSGFAAQVTELAGRVFTELLPGQIHEEVFSDALERLMDEDREGEDSILEQLLADGLGLSPRRRPARGETVIFHGGQAGGNLEPQAVLIDSPEPLLVQGRTEIEHTPDYCFIRSRDGSRSLLIRKSGNQRIPLTPGVFSCRFIYRRKGEELITLSANLDESDIEVAFQVSVQASPPIHREEL
jgi:hypothetical protein